MKRSVKSKEEEKKDSGWVAVREQPEDEYRQWGFRKGSNTISWLDGIE